MAQTHHQDEAAPPASQADGEAATPRQDLVGAALCIAFGAAVVVGAWRMDRLERLNINPYEIPGLVPGLLGALIVALALALAGRAVARGALRVPSVAAPAAARSAWAHMATVFALTLFYALVLVGTGLPFWLSTFVFIAAFVGLLDRERQQALGRAALAQWIRAMVYAAAWSAIVTLSFQHIFLVRLP